MDYTNNVSQCSSAYNPNSTNLFDKFRNPNQLYQQIPQQGQDKITICKDLVADMEYWKEKAALGSHVKGYINGNR